MPPVDVYFGIWFIDEAQGGMYHRTNDPPQFRVWTQAEKREHMVEVPDDVSDVIIWFPASLMLCVNRGNQVSVAATMHVDQVRLQLDFALMVSSQHLR